MKPLYRAVWIILRIYLKIFCRLKVIGEKNMPLTGGVILASNHIAAGDPPFLGTSARRMFFFMAKKELFKNFFLRTLITALNSIPINRGIFDHQALERSEKVLRDGYGLILFPEGTRSKTGELGKGKPGVGMLARKALVPVVPAYIQNSRGFYKLLFNGRRLIVRFGSPITPEWLASQSDHKDGYRAISAEFMRRIAILKSEAEKE